MSRIALPNLRIGGLRQFSFGDVIYDRANLYPNLDLDFATNKNLTDNRSGKASIVSFSRSAASSPGTYVDSQGLIKKSAVNLLFYSEQFDNAVWTKSGADIAANQIIAPDGKQTADEIRAKAITTSLGIFGTGASLASSTTYNISAHFKYVNHQWIWIRGDRPSTAWQAFDIQNGVVGNAYDPSGVISNPSIQNVGNGWYRVSFNITTTSSGVSNIVYTMGNGSTPTGGAVTTFGTERMGIWGAQLEEADPALMRPSDYIKTTSQALCAPRFDHEPTSGNITTNLLLYSEMLNVSSKWTTFNSTVTANATTDPDGGTNADRVTLTNGNLRQKVSGLLSGQTYTYSFYAKTVSGSLSLPIHFSEASVPYSVIGSDTINITNDWQKFIVTVTLSSTSQTEMNVWFGSSVGSGSTGDFYVYQAQLEKSATAGPYVRTLGETRSISDATAPSLGLLIEEERQNLLTNSNDFSGWSKIAAGTGSTPVLTSGFSGPLANGTATRLQVDVGAGTTTSDRSWIEVYPFGIGNQSATIYAKSNNGLTQNIYFGASSSPTSTTAKTVTTDWTRISDFNASVGAASAFRVGVIGAWGDKSADILICAAQAEAAPFPSSYIPTTGTTQTRYADVAAIENEDFSYTNLLSYSESFDVGWLSSGTGTTVNANTAISPNGDLTADEIVALAGFSSGRAKILTGASAGVYTLSFWVRAGTSNTFRFGLYQGSFIPSSASIISGAGSISGSSLFTVTGLDSSWTKISITTTSAISAGTVNIYFYPGPAPASGGESIYLWGAQLTQTEYPVDYVSTRNLLTDSQDFERSSWTKSGLSSWNDGYLDPFGNFEGYRFIENSANGNHGPSKSVTYEATDYVLSFYAKKGARQHLEALMSLADGQSFTIFDLDAGSVLSSGTGVTATITDAGNDWYRCTLSKTLAAGSTTMRIRIGQNSVSYFYVGDGTSDVYIYGVQLEPGSTATDYYRTTDVVGKKYPWYEYTEGTVFVDFANTLQTTNVRFAQLDDGTESNRMQIGSTSIQNNAAIVLGGSIQYINNFSKLDSATIASGFKYNNANSAQNGTLSTPDTTVTLPVFSTLRFGATSGGIERPNGHIKRLIYFPRRIKDSNLKLMTE